MLLVLASSMRFPFPLVIAVGTAWSDTGQDGLSSKLGEKLDQILPFFSLFSAFACDLAVVIPKTIRSTENKRHFRL